MGVMIEQNKVEEKVLKGQMNDAVEKMARDKCCLLVDSMSAELKPDHDPAVKAWNFQDSPTTTTP